MIVFLANITVLIILGMLIRMLIIVCKYANLLDAICAYNMHCMQHWEKPTVKAEDMVHYKDIILNLAKWRYTDIILKEKFELIKPYMKTK